VARELGCPGIDAAVLEEPAHDTEHPDGRGQTGHARPQAAQATHAQRDGNIRQASLVQLADDFRVLELIQFDADAAGPARSLMVHFAANQLCETLAHVVRATSSGP